jgi:hypothetical protein
LWLRQSSKGGRSGTFESSRGELRETAHP